MHPVANKGFRLLSMAASALGNFVFVMGKDKILATTVNIDGVRQMFFDHRRAFNMPAWATTPPGAIPSWLILARWLPQHKVGGFFFVGRIVHSFTGTGNHLVQLAMR